MVRDAGDIKHTVELVAGREIKCEIHCVLITVFWLVLGDITGVRAARLAQNAGDITNTVGLGGGNITRAHTAHFVWRVG